MRTLTASLVLVFVAGSFGPAGAAAPGFSDTICPGATQYVLAVGKLRQDAAPQQIYEAAQAAVDAYERCSTEKLSNGYREPQHYADMRAAGLAVVAARALVALHRSEDARLELLHWRPLVQQVVDWKAETQTTFDDHYHAIQPSAKNPEKPVIPDTPSMRTAVTAGDHRGSLYRDSAKEVVAAIDTQVAQIMPERERPLRQGQSSPAPSPSPKV
jgi:hypothetical protein